MAECGGLGWPDAVVFVALFGMMAAVVWAVLR